MPSNLSRYKSDLEKLLALGEKMQTDLVGKNLSSSQKTDPNVIKSLAEVKDFFQSQYQHWYTESHAVVRQLIPNRLLEFEELYKGDGKRKSIDVRTYNIQDWLMGMRAAPDARTGKHPYDDHAATTMRFVTQLSILRAVQSRFESSLHDIKQLLQADLFDSELDAARELAKNGFVRAAGAVAGVVLERHLSQVAANHKVSTKKQHPTISEFNDILKNGNVVDVPAWRSIQRLGDLRNLCDHNKHRDPTSEEVEELISGVEKLSKTLF
jgi:hypothetical protein